MTGCEQQSTHCSGEAQHKHLRRVALPVTSPLCRMVGCRWNRPMAMSFPILSSAKDKQ
jgi:hypothetical protein